MMNTITSFTRTLWCLTAFIIVLHPSEHSLSQPNYWQSTNGPSGGEVTALAINKKSAELFAGTTSNGIYHSFDRGQTWQNIYSNEMEPGEITSILITKTGYIFASSVYGVLRSLDNGYSWVAVNNGFPYPGVHCIVENQAGYLFAGHGDGVYRSSNYGGTWQKTTSLEINSVMPLIINSKGYIYAGTNGRGMFRSINNGETWENINIGLSDLHVIDLAVNSKDIMYSGHINGGGINYSGDDGNTWHKLYFSDKDIKCLSINTNDSIFVSVLGDGLWFSDSTGITWERIDDGLPYPQHVRAIEFDSAGNIYIGLNDDGVFLSTDNTETWIQSNRGLPPQKYIVSMAESISGKIFAASRQYGGDIFTTVDGGINWAQINSKIGGFINKIISNSIGTLFVGTNKGIYRSVDDGLSWQKVGLTEENITSISINSYNEIFAGTDGKGVFISTDQGDSWNDFNQGIGNYYITELFIDHNNVLYAGTSMGLYVYSPQYQCWIKTFSDKPIYSIAVNNEGVIYAGSTDGELFYSSNAGQQWSVYNFKIQDTYVIALLINQRGDIFASLFGSYGTFTGGTYISFDEGNSWLEMNTGLPDPHVYSFITDKTGFIYQGTREDGIFKSNQSTTIPPHLFSVKDIPLDQGGKVMIRWKASILDTIPNSISHYSIWRSKPEGVDSDIFITADLNFISFGARIRSTQMNGKFITWEWIGDQPAHCFKGYEFVAPTVVDSTSSNTGMHFFMVSAQTYDPDVFYDSFPMSGYSIDNCAPAVPNGLIGSYQSGSIRVDWNHNREPDIWRYLIYRDSSKIISYSVEPYMISHTNYFVDENPIPGDTSFYAVKAQDIHENLSLPSEVIGIYAEITNIEASKNEIPGSFTLYQNYPNPFNPTTTISYDIAEPGEIQLTIYNLLGQKVIKLIDEWHNPGKYSLIFNSKLNTELQNLASGILVCELKTTHIVIRKKMVLIK